MYTSAFFPVEIAREVINTLISGSIISQHIIAYDTTIRWWKIVGVSAQVMSANPPRPATPSAGDLHPPLGSVLIPVRERNYSWSRLGPLACYAISILASVPLPWVQ